MSLNKETCEIEVDDRGDHYQFSYGAVVTRYWQKHNAAGRPLKFIFRNLDHYNEVSFSVPKRRLKKGVASRLKGATDYIVRIDEKTDVALTPGRDSQLKYINHREIVEEKEYVPSFLEQHTFCHVLN